MNSIAQVFPIVICIYLGENPLFITVLITEAIVLTLIAYYLRKGVSVPSEIDIIDAYSLIAITFLISALLCSIPIMISTGLIIDSLFEGISAVTTTGLSTLPTSVLSPGIHIIRSYYQWVGGINVLLMIIFLLTTPGSSTYSIYLAQIGRQKLTPLSISTMSIIIRIYILLTIVYFTVYVLTGLPFFDALINALTTISTGGFSRITYFTGNLLIPGLILMYLSAQPLTIYYLLFRERSKLFFKDPQPLVYAVILALSTLILIIITKTIRLEYLFQLVSAMSTTGYNALDMSNLEDSIKFILSILMIIGACYGSTGGGVKISRMYILFKSIIHVLKKHCVPEKAVLPLRIGGNNISDDEVRLVYILTLLYVITLTFSTLLFTVYGYNLVDSLFEVSSALSTTGLSTGLTSHFLPVELKILLMLDMFLGRLEIIPVLIIITSMVYRKG